MKWWRAAAWFLLAWADLVIVTLVGLHLLLTGAFNDPSWPVVKREILADVFLLGVVVFVLLLDKVKTVKQPAQQPTPQGCRGMQLKRLPY